MFAPRILCAGGAVLAFIGVPASAQTDPQVYADAMIQTGQVMTMNNAIRQGGKGRASRSATSTSRTAQTCANVPRVRARLGAGNPKVQELARLCRQAGY